MKSLSLKVMTLLMAALVLSASGCFNDEMSSPEGTVKGFYRALEQHNFKKMYNYVVPEARPVRSAARSVPYLSAIAHAVQMRAKAIKYSLTDVKITLVSKEEGLAWTGDKWGNRTWATFELTARNAFKNEEIKNTVILVLLNNKWYMEEVPSILRLDGHGAR